MYRGGYVVFCYKCGNKIDDNAKFCPACGARQGNTLPVNEIAEKPAPRSAEPAKQSNTKGRKKLYTGIIAGACAVVVCAAVVAGIYFWGPGGEKETPSGEQSLQTEGEKNTQDDKTGVNIGGNAANSGIKVQEEQSSKVPADDNKIPEDNNIDESENSGKQEQPAETMSPIRQQVAEEMAQIEAQSDDIKQELNSAMSQSEMNKYSGELYQLWDDYINVLWGYLGENLSEAEFSELTDEQLDWIAEKEAAVEEAGNEVKGGTMEPLVRNSLAAEWTEQRVYELIEYLP